VEAAQADGSDVRGPFPADTLFLDAKNGLYDGIVAIYHDQGHIAMKAFDMFSAVNVALGLPIIRTSVAHGTAFQVAGTGTAKTESLIEAVRVAALFAAKKRTP
ncbi:MAG: 4-hydroxythreonine-4-phosphate dehydrogenase PdxA, partial [Thermoguttaceae bacterium]|nr:4-hydroxythreonine-4-phosphate dehydrogenase PdxA [Thermoguttaceae bacterium]